MYNAGERVETITRRLTTCGSDEKEHFLSSFTLVLSVSTHIAPLSSQMAPVSIHIAHIAHIAHMTYMAYHNIVQRWRTGGNDSKALDNSWDR